MAVIYYTILPAFQESCDGNDALTSIPVCLQSVARLFISPVNLSRRPYIPRVAELVFESGTK